MPDTLEQRMNTTRLRTARAVDLTDDDLLDLSNCPRCHPFDCEDPDAHLGAPAFLTPNKNRGCVCGADYTGRDCCCFEDYD